VTHTIMEQASALVGGLAEQVSAAPPARPGLPPGPRLPLAVQTLLAVFATERYSTYVRRHYHSMATLRAAGLGELVAVWDPTLIKQVLTGDPDVLRGGELNARVLEAPAGKSSVMVLDGEPHLRMRRLLSPPFHGEAVRRYGELVAQAAGEDVGRWPVGEVIATRPRMQAITLEVILKAVIGTRDERRLARMRTVLAKLGRAGLFTFIAESANPG
jgi:cytochrome P450